jgi:DNA-binding CsgD family transcriptional regulator
MDISTANIVKKIIEISERCIDNMCYMPYNVKLFSNTIFLLVNSELKVEYFYRNENRQMQEVVHIIKDNPVFSDGIFGKSAFQIAQNMKTFSFTQLDKNLKSFCSYASPISKENGEIICYLGAISREMEINPFLMLLIIILSDLILCKVKIEIIKEKMSSFNALNLNILTDKEKFIAKLISRGLSDSLIAKELYISISTVRSHVNSIYGKTNIKNRSHLASSFLYFELGNLLL